MLEGATFLGCTPWTDFALNETQEMSLFEAMSAMNDNKRIKFSKKPYVRFTPRRTVRFHFDSRAFVERELSAAVGTIDTHHAPNRLSLPEQFKSDRLSPAYVSTWRA